MKLCTNIHDPQRINTAVVSHILCCMDDIFLKANADVRPCSPQQKAFGIFPFDFGLLQNTSLRPKQLHHGQMASCVHTRSAALHYRNPNYKCWCIGVKIVITLSLSKQTSFFLYCTTKSCEYQFKIPFDFKTRGPELQK